MPALAVQRRGEWCVAPCCVEVHVHVCVALLKREVASPNPTNNHFMLLTHADKAAFLSFKVCVPTLNSMSTLN